MGASHCSAMPPIRCIRSEEHTSELQSLRHLVCRLLLEKKKEDHKGDDLQKHDLDRVEDRVQRCPLARAGRADAEEDTYNLVEQDDDRIVAHIEQDKSV